MSAIIVHGGAGLEDAEREPRCIAGCQTAAAAGWRILEQGGSALDAVVEAVRVLENDPEYNAGTGSVLARDGRVYVDAAVMDGTLRAGAVAAAPDLANAVLVARRALERGEHVLYAGAGALDFARSEGFSPSRTEALIVPRQRERFERERQKHAHDKKSGDTVGAAAVDVHGAVAAATSTGGISYKHPGRVGDSPLVGAGLFADDEVGAVSATGHGESILRVVLCKDAIDRMRRNSGATLDDIARQSLAELGRRTGGTAGIILVDRLGRTGHATSTERMPWAAVVDGATQQGA